MPISQARTIAFDVLLRVANQDAYADDVLRAQLDGTMKTEDAGLATELALGVLRWQRLLDFAIDRYLKKPADMADMEVRIALRLGFYQLLFLDRVPAHAAVNESVELVKRARKHSAATLVNAVLRKAAKEKSSGNLHLRPLHNSFPLNFPSQNGLEFNIRIPTGWSNAGFELLEKNGRAHCSWRTIAPRRFRRYLLDPERRRKRWLRSNGLDALSCRDDCC